MAAANFIDLLDKYLENRLSTKETTQLEELLKDKENARVFKQTVQDIYLLKTEAITFDAQKAFEKTQAKVKKRQEPRTIVQLLRYLPRVAAILLIGWGIHYLISDNDSPQLLPPSSKVATLTLADGAIFQFDNTMPDTLKNAQQTAIGIYADGQLRYLPTNADTSPNQHILTTPYGTTMTVVLADGSRVKLNAGSTMLYSNHFNNIPERNIQFSGEAIFKVAKNPQQPFKIRAAGTVVEVLGTQFNLAAYPDDTLVTTTLEEGAVKVYAIAEQQKSINLVPGEQAIWQKTAQQLTKQTVNEADYRSWSEGKLVFQNTPLATIFKQLERKFDVTITVQNDELNTEQVTAHFDNKSIEQILSYLQIIQDFDYQRDGRTILIK